MVSMEDCIHSISINGELDQTPLYSVTQAAKLCELSVHTLRYYDTLGLFPFLQRNASEKRLFSKADLQWIKLIECLRNSGMSIKNVQYYVQLCLLGNESLNARLLIIDQQEAILEEQIKHMQESLNLLKFKKNYYLSTINS